MRYVPGREVLFQERLMTQPFWMLVMCQLVNLTSIDQAEPVLEQLMDNYDIPSLAEASIDEVTRIIRPIGLYNRKAKTIINMARVFHHFVPPKTSHEVFSLSGCGQYAVDSWKIFIEGNMDVQPNDGRLQWYLHRERTKT